MTNELAIRILTGDVLGTASQTSEAIKTAVKALSISSAQPELTDGQAIEHLQETGWMQNHDKQMYEMGLREQLADDSDSYDALLPSSQPELARINDCNGCKFIGCYDTDFPCANCVRKDKDYYEPEG